MELDYEYQHKKPRFPLCITRFYRADHHVFEAEARGLRYYLGHPQGDHPRRHHLFQRPEGCLERQIHGSDARYRTYFGYFVILIYYPPDVYSLCVAYPEPLADRLYNETKIFLEEHVGGLLENRVKKGGDQSLLKNYHEAWNEFSQGINYLHMLYSYLNNQHIRKQKMSEAELTYGSLSIEHMEQMKEIGELGLDTWKRLVRLHRFEKYFICAREMEAFFCYLQMIDPLKSSLVRLLLDGIRHDRLGETSGSTKATLFQSDSVIKGVINSFVSVEEYKKKGNLDVS